MSTNKVLEQNCSLIMLLREKISSVNFFSPLTFSDFVFLFFVVVFLNFLTVEMLHVTDSIQKNSAFLNIV